MSGATVINNDDRVIRATHVIYKPLCLSIIVRARDYTDGEFQFRHSETLEPYFTACLGDMKVLHEVIGQLIAAVELNP
jgi:hypothetical protein